MRNTEFQSIILKTMSIYVYNDEGAGETSLKHTIHNLENITTSYKINFIDAEGILYKEWTKDAVLLIMPGGADIPYAKKLNGEGNNIIRQYVENGGNYLGFCAGAYYASSFVEFDKGGKLEVIEERELAFFPNKSVGPILAKYDYKSHSGARAALLKLSIDYNDFLNDNIRIYYNGGGYFQNANLYTNVKVIADYQLENDTFLPAIVEMKYNKGIVILSGVHFEYSTKILDDSDPYDAKLLPILEMHEEDRIKFNIAIFKILGIHVKLNK